jgi:hypothetical protein
MAGTAAASVPAQHPRAADPTPYATHTQWRGGPQRLTLPSPRLLTGPAIICHTGPARTFDKDRQTLGQLYDGGTLPCSEPPLAAPKDRDELPGLAVRARSVRQSFHAFGNDLAELHHLLAQSRVFHDVAMDAFAVRTELFTQVA